MVIDNMQIALNPSRPKFHMIYKDISNIYDILKKCFILWNCVLSHLSPLIPTNGCIKLSISCIITFQKLDVCWLTCLFLRILIS